MSVRIGPFAPTQIAGCQLWLDAADASTVTLVSSKVSQWNDKSGNGFHVSQGNASYRPTYAGTRNGKSVVTFSTSSSTLLGNASASLLRGVAGHTTFLVGLPTANGGGRYSFHIRMALNNRIRVALYSSATRYWYGSAYRTWTDSVGEISTTTAPTLDKCDVMCMVADFSAARLGTIFVNGVQQGQTSSFASQGVTDNNSGDVYVGAYIGGDGGTYNPFDGDVAEVVVFNSVLSNANRITVENYLRAKWGTG